MLERRDSHFAKTNKHLMKLLLTCVVQGFYTINYVLYKKFNFWIHLAKHFLQRFKLRMSLFNFFCLIIAKVWASIERRLYSQSQVVWYEPLKRTYIS